MKQVYKSFIFLIISWFLGQQAYSQVRFGVKAGMNLSNAKFKEPFTPNPNIRIGYNAGILANFKLSKKIIIQPELLYAVKGWRFPATQNGGSGTLTLYYINLPVLVGYKPIPNLCILAGPETGLMINAVSRFDGNKIDVTEFYKKFDLGIDVGVSYKINPKIGIEVRYNHGFSKLVEAMYTDENGNPVKAFKDGYNRVVQVGIFYFLTKK